MLSSLFRAIPVDLNLFYTLAMSFPKLFDFAGARIFAKLWQCQFQSFSILRTRVLGRERALFKALEMSFSKIFDFAGALS